MARIAHLMSSIYKGIRYLSKYLLCTYSSTLMRKVAAIVRKHCTTNVESLNLTLILNF